jgi:hypothetical protein
MEYTYFGKAISEYESVIEIKVPKQNKLNGMTKRHFGKQMLTETKLLVQ